MFICISLVRLKRMAVRWVLYVLAGGVLIAAAIRLVQFLSKV